MLALLGIVVAAAACAFSFLFLRPVKRVARSMGAEQPAPRRVLGCFDLQAENGDCSEGELWERQRNPRASVGGLRHSLKFEQYSRERDVDVDKEEEKLAAYRELRKCDREAFKRLLSQKPNEYKAYDAFYLPRAIALLDYLFLILGVYLVRKNMSYFFFCWATIVVVTSFCCQSTPLTLGSKSRGYYVCDEHNRLAERVRIISQMVLELIFVYCTWGAGAAVSVALKMKSKKRQSLMELCAGVWVITECQEEAEIY
ncbi:hypothetical protein BSKO_09222 [Bryopsis sp. KO-2023]|nr:hypothetical protein BSKO_09222 [Bryopsis sp. KO-2023]